MKNFPLNQTLSSLVNLLRWNKPTGRIILLIPAGWALWLNPSAPPSNTLVGLIILGGILVSGSGCIANDLWDKNIDSQVSRTKSRPLANGSLTTATALIAMAVLLFASFQVIFLLPPSSQALCLKLSAISLLPILLYPSSKRWFKYPQALLAICWGFAVLIPWAASNSSLNGGVPLITCWMATMIWTFGFDTIYAMADKEDDDRLGLNSSALALGPKAFKAVAICYALTSILIGLSALTKGINLVFWPIWLLASVGMQREVLSLKASIPATKGFGRHFKNQTLLGSLILSGLILGSL
ncbi:MULTISPECIES: 4-hydroxybenzoate polyprenyltransferase [unclassified Prochlorococcus]|uniref:4-hydroxybenzoate polyprenyltransferase n=1 Tax=unclassified Prochlorococcus TaxID=2627481 RepID=UPI0005339105|nr:MULTISPECIES: 4-hydroxybenzoate polyprenyltransferase [unclassified Prochlorococcus]KGG16502.1 4-hydroxybenzoate polyprenyltransferase [Prochlorococcus sp. MIT 0602]